MDILIPLVIILIAEYIGDFLLQDRKTALNKSSNIRYLLRHLGSIFWVLVIGTTAAFAGTIALAKIVPFVACYCLIHGIQDWFIWRVYKASVISRLGYTKMNLEHPPIKEDLNSFKYWEDKAFYDVIGLDRLLHVITLIILYGVFFL